MTFHCSEALVVAECEKRMRVTKQRQSIREKHQINQEQQRQQYIAAERDFEHKQALFQSKQEAFHQLQQDFQRQRTYFSQLSQELAWEREQTCYVLRWTRNELSYS
jgi:hypothetical protein